MSSESPAPHEGLPQAYEPPAVADDPVVHDAWEVRATWAAHAAGTELARLEKWWAPAMLLSLVLVIPLVFLGWPLAVFLGWATRTRLRALHSLVLDAGSPPHLTYRLDTLRLRYRMLWLGTVWIGGLWCLFVLLIALLPAP